jgi:hypothetical protein
MRIFAYDNGLKADRAGDKDNVLYYVHCIAVPLTSEFLSSTNKNTVHQNVSECAHTYTHME